MTTENVLSILLLALIVIDQAILRWQEERLGRLNTRVSWLDAHFQAHLERIQTIDTRVTWLDARALKERVEQADAPTRRD